MGFILRIAACSGSRLITHRVCGRRYENLPRHVTGLVMRSLMLIATLLSWIVCFTSDSANIMAMGLFFGIVGMIATTLAFAQAHIDAQARPEATIELVQHHDQHDEPPSA